MSLTWSLFTLSAILVYMSHERCPTEWALTYCILKNGCPELIIRLQPMFFWYMMTSSNGNFFRITDPLCGEFTGPGEFPTQRPVTRSFDVFFDLRLNKRLGKQPLGWWFETPWWSSWRQCNETPRQSYNTIIIIMLEDSWVKKNSPMVKSSPCT